MLTRVVKTLKVESNAEYREIGIRSHCRGIFHKSPVTGKQLGSKRVFWVEPRCLVLNIVFAWEQAVAVTGENERGMIASHRFPMYRSIDGKLLPEYAFLYFLSPRGKYDLGLASPGGAGRNKTLGQEEFRCLKIPVPPTNYQKFTIKVIRIWDEAITQTEKLVAAKRKFKNGLMQQLLTGKQRFSEFKGAHWREVQLGDVVEVNPRCIHPFGLSTLVTFLAMSDIAEGGGISNRQVRTLREVSSGYTAFQEGDILVAKITPCFENYKGAVATNLINGIGFGSTEFHVLRPSQAVNTRFIYYLTLLHPFRGRGTDNMTGSAGQKRVPANFLRTYRVKLPPIDEQRRIAAVLDRVDREIDNWTRFLELLSEQKRGLMQKLLTGQIRVKATEDMTT